MRKVLAGILAGLLVAVSPVFVSESVRAAEVPVYSAVTETLSDSAEVLLFEDYGDGQILVYADGGEVHMQQVGLASLAAQAAQPGGRNAFLRGGLLVVTGEFDGLLLVQPYDADTLASLEMSIPEFDPNDARFIEADTLGRIFIVPDSRPTEVRIFDAYGSAVTTLDYGEEIFGLQFLNNAISVFCADWCDRIDVRGSSITAGENQFAYAAADRPLRMLSDDLYVDTQGRICRISTNALLLETGLVPLTHALTRLNGSDVLWADGAGKILCQAVDDSVKYFHEIDGKIESITETAALSRIENRLCVTPFGTFEAVPTPTPVPTEAPTPTPKPSATAKPTNTPKPTATPSPVPTPIPALDELVLPEGMVRDGSVLWVPEGTTAAQLKKAFEPYAVSVYSSQMTPASAKLRTGMFAVIDSGTYTILMRGDLNASGTVNKADLQLLQRALAGLYDLSGPAAQAADMNADGDLTISDAVILSGVIS